MGQSLSLSLPIFYTVTIGLNFNSGNNGHRLKKYNDSFTLAEMDSGTDSELDSKPGGYILVCRTFHNTQTLTHIPTPYFCTGQESKFESVPMSFTGNVNEPLRANRLLIIIVVTSGGAPCETEAAPVWYLRESLLVGGLAQQTHGGRARRGRQGHL